MAKFKLSMSEDNVALAKFLKAEGCRVEHTQTELIVNFDFGLTISRLEASSVIKGLTDDGWRRLVNEIKSTLEGGKIRELSDWVIGIRPLKTSVITIRIDPLEKHMIQEAAIIERKTLSEFIRWALAKATSEVFDKNTIERQTRQQEQQKEPYLA